MHFRPAISRLHQTLPLNGPIPTSQCLPQYYHRPLSIPYAFQKSRHRQFTTSHIHYDDPKQTHYEVLKVSPDASAKELKRQFYELSKETHPDHHRNDPKASERFSQISESYSVLADPEKRKKYDRDVMRGHPSTRKTGSYAGSRPATGLSKRRSAFRGPPPSYFAQGGKPPNYQQANQQEGQTQGSGGSGSFADGPTAAENLGSQYTYSYEDASPFSTASVYRTQTHEDNRRRDRRAAALAEALAEAEDYSSNFWARFVIVTGIVVLSVTVGTLFVGMSNFGPRGNAMGTTTQGRAGGLVRSDGTRRDRDASPSASGNGRNLATKG